MTETFDNALEGLRMTGASVDTRDMVQLLVRHGAEEGQLLATYEKLADESADEATGPAGPHQCRQGDAKTAARHDHRARRAHHQGRHAGKREDLRPGFKTPPLPYRRLHKPPRPHRRRDRRCAARPAG